MNFEKICTKCGACCAYFRILLSPADLLLMENHLLDRHISMVEQIGDYLYIMKGTSSPNSRCVALEGEIGKLVKCKIYEIRPQICKDFNPLTEDGNINAYCNKARQKYNLPLLTPHDFIEFYNDKFF